MRQYIQNIPKCELHLHIEGTLEPELMFELSKRNNIEIPFDTVEEISAAYNFSNLQDFLDIYYQGAQVLQTEQDFYDLTMAYLKKVHSENVRHVEIFFDPQTHTERGIEFGTVIKGIKQALLDAEENMDISHHLIMSYLRHLTEEEAFETLKQSLPFKEMIFGVGLDSSEMGHPPSKFERVFKASVEEGYIPMAHAGEEGPAEYIHEALDLLDVARIDHGNRCLTDEELVERLVEKGIGLTICPLSNLELKVVTDMQQHPIKVMLDKGLMVSCNSDDPAYFGGYMNDNFIAIAEALSLDKKDIYLLVKNSFDTSFMSEDRKAQLMNELKAFYVHS